MGLRCLWKMIPLAAQEDSLQGDTAALGFTSSLCHFVEINASLVANCSPLPRLLARN